MLRPSRRPSLAGLAFGLWLFGVPATVHAVACAGDCGSDGAVTVDELLAAVGIALGQAPASTCNAADLDGDAQVTVDELLAAVQSALVGCPEFEARQRLGDRLALDIDTTSASLTLRRGDTTLLRLPRDGIQLGAVDALDDNNSYDPYPLVIGQTLARRPLNLRWLTLRSARVVDVTSDQVRLALEFDEAKSASLVLQRLDDGRFSSLLVPDSSGVPIAYFRLRTRSDSQEGFYGLGEVFDAVNHRGRVRAMQLEADLDIESSNNEAHVPIPLLIGTTAWGLFVESPYPGVFEVANEEPDLVEVTFGLGAASAEGLRFHLFAADHPLDVTRHYYAATSFPKLPARWAYGPWIWRDESDDQAQVESDANIIRELDLATSAYWIDRPYASGVNAFDFEARRFPDPPRMVGTLRDLGFRVALWHTPYVDASDADTAPLAAEARERGFFPPRTSLLLNGWSRPIDFTNPDAKAWWQDKLGYYVELGIEGFKLDFAEDVIPGIAGRRNVWQFHDGSDERSMQSRYRLFYHGTYAELLDPDNGFLLCRAGTYGTQQFPCVIWPGDLDANMAYHREVVTDGDARYVAVGGLPAAVIAGNSLGPSGLPFFGSDTGGYRHSPPNKETFTRWFQHTALSSIMQIGTSTNDVAWEFRPSNGFDQEMLDWYREYTRLHLRLFPYVWSYAERLRDDGRPIQRALGLAHPELGVHPDDIYLLGDDLLVAPVVRPEVRARDVIFPEGDWFDWWTGERLAGGVTRTVDAPLSKLPLYQRAGSIVPLLRPTIDSLSPTTEPERVDSYATTPGVLWARVAPGPATSVQLFDGTRLEQRPVENGVEVTIVPGTEFTAGLQIEIVGRDLVAAEADAVPLERRADLAELESTGIGWVGELDGAVRSAVRLGPSNRSAVLRFAEAAE